MQPPEGYRVRKMDVRDLPAVLELEQKVYPAPWTYRMFLGEVRNPLGWTRVVEAEGGELVGYLVSRYYGDVWHLMNVSIAPEHRRQGLAGFLLDELVLLAADSGVDLTLEVRVSNEAAIRLYDRRDFQVSGRRPAYYHANREDAYIMVRPHEGQTEARRKGRRG